MRPNQASEALEALEKGFKAEGIAANFNSLLNGTAESALRRFAMQIVDGGEWPTHLTAQKPTPTISLADLREALRSFFSWAKGSGDAADLLAICSKEEMPEFIVNTLISIQKIIEPPEATDLSVDEDDAETLPEGEALTV